ncbi:MAG: hypothetical protein ACI8RD_007693 [Bacillariaceae sp.]|jgi:hypothetical protein
MLICLNHYYNVATLVLLPSTREDELLNAKLRYLHLII